MQTWQKIWLIILLVFFSLHTIRDILQKRGIKTFLATYLTKKNVSKVPSWYWKVFNEFLIEIAIIILCIQALSNNRFDLSAYVASLLAVFFEIVWLIYYFLL